MRAAWYDEQGPANEVLGVGELATPEAGPGEVRVETRASGINPVDVKRRTGGRGGMASSRVVPHFDGAGVIDQVGEGVDDSRLGERVWVHRAQWQSDFGTAADYFTLPAERALPLPSGTSFDEGACLGIPAMTAHRCVFADGPVDGQTILVTGGAGAVGNYAVQFAHLGGARVFSTASSDEKGAIATDAGADVAINYRTENVAERVADLTDGSGLDRVVEVEMGGNLEDSIAMLKPNGVLSSYASEGSPEPSIPFYQLLYKNLTFRFELVFLTPESGVRQATDDLHHWLSEGQLRHHVAARHSLDDIVAAHEAVEAGPTGKVLLTWEG